jgi:hypothetical protein
LVLNVTLLCLLANLAVAAARCARLSQRRRAPGLSCARSSLLSCARRSRLATPLHLHPPPGATRPHHTNTTPRARLPPSSPTNSAPHSPPHSSPTGSIRFVRSGQIKSKPEQTSDEPERGQAEWVRRRRRRRGREAPWSSTRGRRRAPSAPVSCTPSRRCVVRVS